jgi:hypothetical protein
MHGRGGEADGTSPFNIFVHCVFFMNGIIIVVNSVLYIYFYFLVGNT